MVHPGRVNVSKESDLTLRKWHSAGQSGDTNYEALKQRFMAERAALASGHVAAVLRSLFELAEHAARRGVRLGLENRYYYHEIPLPDELEILLSVNWGGVVGFWYDVGHALSLENLGYLKHGEWLERFSSQIVGVHLHDVAGYDDHRPVGLGDVEWEAVLPHIPANALVTCEFKNCYSAEQVRAGLLALREKFNGP